MPMTRPTCNPNGSSLEGIGYLYKPWSMASPQFCQDGEMHLLLQSIRPPLQSDEVQMPNILKFLQPCGHSVLC
ncbi:unnamed protein product [Urochloa humidicola]